MTKPFYFIVVVWGEKYLAELANFCIPSLLSPRNLPGLGGKTAHRLILVTPRPEIEIIEGYPIMGLWRQYAEVTWLEIPPPSPRSSSYDHMNKGYKEGIEFAIADEAYGVLLTPDLIVSDGTLLTMTHHAQSGVKVLLTAALRYGEEPLFSFLTEAGHVSRESRLGEKGIPLCISGRELAQAGINSLHTETLRFEWDAAYYSPAFTGLPGASWWRIPGEDAMIVHTTSWAPLLIDFGNRENSHDTSTIERWSIDGDYVHRNFGIDADVRVIRDSDEAMIVSWTPMAFLNLSLAPNPIQLLPKFGSFFKGSLLRDAVLGPTSDPLKKHLFFIPVFFHAKGRSEAWLDVEHRSTAILHRYLASDVQRLRRAAMSVIGVIYRSYALLMGRWGNRRHIAGSILRCVKGDKQAWKWPRHRTRLYWRQFLGRSISGD